MLLAFGSDVTERRGFGATGLVGSPTAADDEGVRIGDEARDCPYAGDTEIATSFAVL
jgi:hypothetical protein